jgi:hypothetical protein
LPASRTKPQYFDEINVGRINVVEPDGTLRLMIANRPQFPGSYVHGKEIEPPDRQGWMMKAWRWAVSRGEAKRTRMEKS